MEKDREAHIKHVVEVYHEQLKVDCQNLLNDFQKSTMTTACIYLSQAKDAFNYLTQKINFHLVLEENVVFPMILNSSNQERLGYITATMESEHVEDDLIIKEIIDTLRKSDASDQVSALLNELEKFRVQFQEHTHYEDEYIFKT